MSLLQPQWVEQSCQPCDMVATVEVEVCTQMLIRLYIFYEQHDRLVHAIRLHHILTCPLDGKRVSFAAVECSRLLRSVLALCLQAVPSSLFTHSQA